jgi:putative spermidine/putrescine transport system ATP-binding protein
MGSAALKLSSLTCRAGSRLVLDSFTLSAEPGLVTAVVGPAGSGKSTLIRCIAGLQAPQGGGVELDGNDMAGVPAWRRGFGVVLHPDGLFPHLTLAENVAFPLRMRRIKQQERNGLVATALDLVQLSAAAHQLAASASAAERQRAAIARATVFAPAVLLLDEPVSAQDPAGRVALIAGLRRIHALLGCTTILATRIGADALALADRIAVLRDGSLEQVGGSAEVFDEPRNDYVAAQLGEVNRLAGVALRVEEGLAMVRLACGPVVQARSGRTLQEGDPCVFAVRPDRIAVAAASAADLGGPAIDATVVEAVFLGDAYRLRMLIGSGAELVVRRSAAAGLRGMGVGAGVAVAWMPHHGAAFRAP